MLLEAKGDPNFFIGNAGKVRRQSRIEWPLVVSGTPSDGHLEQPLRQTIIGAAHSGEPDCQTRNMRHIPEFFPQRLR